MVESKKRKRIVVFALVVLAIVAALLVFLNTGTKTETPSQTTDTVLMVSPVAFDYNEETAVNNAFQEEDNQSNTAEEAREESDAYIKLLEDNGINVIAGNMLELHNKDGQPCLVMSLAAYNSLTKEQVEFLESKMTLITPDLECIEQNGGGSARCMIAEIF